MIKNIVSLLLAPITILLILGLCEYFLTNSIGLFFIAFGFTMYITELLVILPIFIFYRKKIYNYKFCIVLGMISGLLVGFLSNFSYLNINLIRHFTFSREGVISILGMTLGFIVSSSFYVIHKKLDKYFEKK